MEVASTAQAMTTLRGPTLRGPRGIYWGWVIVAALSVTETTSWGILYYSPTVFLLPMERELGWTRAQLSGALSLSLLVAALAAVPVGRWLDRHGPRAIMTVGSCLATLTVLAWSRVESLTTFYAIWLVNGVLQAVLLYEPAFATLAVWFRRRRAVAMTALTLVAGLASTIFLPLASWLVEGRGWRAALGIFAVMLAVLTVPLHAFVLRRRPADYGLVEDGEAPRPEEPGRPPAA